MNDPFEENARSNGVLIDTNLLVVLVVGTVNRDRLGNKRTSHYTTDDWDLLAGFLEQFPRRYTLPHVLAEVSALTDLKGDELAIARTVLQRVVTQMEELLIPSVEACGHAYYQRLGLTDAAIGLAAMRRGCSVLTNDSALYSALMGDGFSVLKFDHLRRLL